MTATCDVCQTELEENETDCVVCAEADKVAGGPGAPSSGRGGVADTAAAARTLDIDKLRALQQTLAGPGAKRDGPALETSPLPDPQPTDPSAGDAREHETPQQRARPPAEEGGQEQDISDADLKALGASELYVVGLLGFPTAGKTWFLNRLKSVCLDRFSPLPPPAANGTVLPRTFAVTAHRFVKQGSGFAIVDIPGERFLAEVADEFRGHSKLLEAVKICDALLIVLPSDEALFAARAVERHGETPGAPAIDFGEQKAEGEEAKKRLERFKELEAAQSDASKAVRAAQKILRSKPGNRAATKALEAAKSTLQAIKAEQKAGDVKAGRNLADTNERLKQFIHGIGRMAGVISLRDLTPSDQDTGVYSDTVIADHIISDEFKPCDRPTFIALTKADLLERPSPMIKDLVKGQSREEAVLAEYDLDPLHTVHTFRPDLANSFDKWFAWSKFDFVTAFSGQRAADEVIRYDTDHHGVDAIIEWVEWASGSNAWRDRDRADIAAARTLRRFRDGASTRKRNIGTRKGAQRG